MPKIFIILVVLAILGGGIYYWQNKTSPLPASQIPNQAEPLAFGEYQLNLPEGFIGDKIVNSGIDTVSTGVCMLNPEDVLKDSLPCKYLKVKVLNDKDTVIIIADTPKWGLGGGGYITTVNEKINLGPQNFKTEFNTVWIGRVDSNGEPTSEKLLLDNGNPVLYYVTGCLQHNLCIHMNAKQSEEGSFGYTENSWQLDKFKEFVNSLKISKR